MEVRNGYQVKLSGRSRDDRWSMSAPMVAVDGYSDILYASDAEGEAKSITTADVLTNFQDETGYPTVS